MRDRTAIVVGAGSVGPGWGNGKATAAIIAAELVVDGGLTAKVS